MEEIIATFQVMPFSAFSNTPGGANDSGFVLGDSDPSQLWTVTLYDNDNVVDGDAIQGETADDDTQYAVITDADGNVVSTEVLYLEWTATYESEDGDALEVWRFETEDNIRMFAMSEMPTEGEFYSQVEKDMNPMDADPADIPQLSSVPCLTRGAMIQTDKGLRRVEHLRVGDMVETLDNGLQPILWIGNRRFGARDLDRKMQLRPIRIVAGALGNGLPTQDMLVSRQHRMLVTSRIAQNMFSGESILVPAVKLTALPGIYLDVEVQDVEYFHLLFDSHQVIFADGAPTESLYVGPEAIQALSPLARREIMEILPDLIPEIAGPAPAYEIPGNKRQNKLVMRHAKNGLSPLERFAPDQPTAKSS